MVHQKSNYLVVGCGKFFAEIDVLEHQEFINEQSDAEYESPIKLTKSILLFLSRFQKETDHTSILHYVRRYVLASKSMSKITDKRPGIAVEILEG